MGITPLALLLDELTLLDERTEELLEEITLLLDDERILEEISELDELDLELAELLDKPQLPTTPKGEGWLVHVDVEIQLLLFSYPHPLWVETQTGYKVPYQLHCCVLAHAELVLDTTDDLLDELNTDEEEREDGATDDGTTDEDTLDERKLDATDDAAPQIAPVTTGVSTAPLVFT